MEQSTFNQIKTVMEQILQISEKELKTLTDICQKHIYLKGTYYSTPENPSNQLGYVTKGLFRLYKLDLKGKEHTVAFTSENMFISSYSAIIHNQHQIVYVQAVENSEVYSCDRLQFLKLWELYDVWKIFLQKGTEQDCLSIRKRESDFLMFDAKTRYQIFLKDFPQYQNRIKQEYIASYLGISPETLSRIKTN